ncbi:MAG: ABC transporter permease [Ruminococcus sp.]|nr:ABC transporter permease [Ruminococcus sp.]
MFLHNFKYELLAQLRVRTFILWLLVFPIALGFFFKLTFIGIYEKDSVFNTIPAAVDTTEDDPTLRAVLDQMEKSDSPVIRVSYLSAEEADRKLKDDDVEGIIRSEGGVLKLTVAGLGMNETILKSFCDKYNSNAEIIRAAAASDPTKAGEISGMLMKDVNTVEDIKLVNGNTDYYTEYFYNLIAMVGLFGALIGLSVTIDNQANLSALGARKNCSPTPKSVSMSASLVSKFLIQSVCMVWCVSFQHFVLGINFGDHLLLVYLAAIFSGILGVSLGFMVGSIGRGGKDIKSSITTAVVMFSCFLSGLMVGNIKSLIGKFAPIVNEINPASVISDCFHCLNIYDSYDKFISKIITMAVMTFVFSFVGFIMTRRRKYASL